MKFTTIECKSTYINKDKGVSSDDLVLVGNLNNFELIEKHNLKSFEKPASFTPSDAKKISDILTKMDFPRDDLPSNGRITFKINIHMRAW